MKTTKILKVTAATAILLTTAPILAQGEDQAAQMAAVQKAMTPNDHHAAIARLAGEWTAEVTVWFQPGAEASVSKGKMSSEMVMGGRYLQQHFESEMMGSPFNGFGLAGYDNVAGRHTMVWADSMSTRTSLSEGTCADNHAVETYHLTTLDPMGNEQKVRFLFRVVDDDHHVFEYFMRGPGGTEFKSMEIVYRRV